MTLLGWIGDTGTPKPLQWSIGRAFTSHAGDWPGFDPISYMMYLRCGFLF